MVTTTSHFDRTFRVTNSAIKLFNTIKPYHTHVLDVVEEYRFEEQVTPSVVDTMTLTVKYVPRPDCDGEGWGTYYDNTFCGYDAVKCCEPFTCTGGFGVVWDSTNLFARHTILDVSLEQNTFRIQGRHNVDVRLPIVSYPAANVVRVSAPPEMVSLFTGDGDTTPLHPVFELSPYRDVAVRSVSVEHNRLELDSKTPADFNGLMTVREISGIHRQVTITNVTTTSLGYVVVTIDNSQPITTNDATSVVLVHQPTLNAGTYTLWNRVISAPGVVPVIYQPGTSTTVVVPGTIDIRVSEEFPSPVEFNKGALAFRTGLVYPRRITVDDSEFIIVSSQYSATSDDTTITVSSPVGNQLGSNLELRGYDGGQGYDGYPTCQTLSDTLLAPLLTEQVSFTFIESAPPTAFRLTQSTVRFSAPQPSTTVNRIQVILDRIPSASNLRFGTPVFPTVISYSLRPVAVSLLSVGPSQDVETGTVVTLTAALDGPVDGHTVEWELTSGDLITPTIIDPLTITYLSNLPTPGNRIWTFYVDRGTPNEQSMTALVRQVIHATQPIDGIAVTTSLGQVTPVISTPITGVSGTVSPGTPIVAVRVPLSGIDFTATPGTPVINVSTPIIGVEVSSLSGTPTATVT